MQKANRKHTETNRQQPENKHTTSRQQHKANMNQTESTRKQSENTQKTDRKQTYHKPTSNREHTHIYRCIYIYTYIYIYIYIYNTENNRNNQKTHINRQHALDTHTKSIKQQKTNRT